MEGKNNLIRKHSKSLYSNSKKFKSELRNINIRVSDSIPIIETEEELINRISGKRNQKGKSDFDLQNIYHNYFQTTLIDSNREQVNNEENIDISYHKLNKQNNVLRNDSINNMKLLEKLELINTFNHKLTSQENQTDTEVLFTKI